MLRQDRYVPFETTAVEAVTVSTPRETVMTEVKYDDSTLNTGNQLSSLNLSNSQSTEVDASLDDNFDSSLGCH